MKIGFIGTGNVGATLARKLGQKGHSLFLGVRNLKDDSATTAAELAREIGLHASVHEIPSVVEQAEVIFLATPWSATESIVKSLKGLSGKILVDCTNPLKSDLSGLEVGFDTSGAERIQSWAPQARVIKAFNTTGFNIMQDPLVAGRRAAMHYCGDDPDARFSVQQLIQDVGFEPIDAGPLASARLLEPFALLWIQSAYRFGLGREFAFGILRKETERK